MTRNDYELIAQALAKSQPKGTDNPYTAHLATIDAIADVMAAQNARFDRRKFFAAATKAVR